MSASPSTLRETLRGHNIFWLENVEISSSYELTKSDLAALLRGDPHSYLHGLFQSHTPDRVKVNIPPHVRQLRSLLLDSNSLFDNENGIEKLKPAVIERYNSEKGCILSTHPQSKEEILQSHWKDLKGALQSVLTSDAAFFKKYFFDGFTRSGTQFPGLSTSGATPTSIRTNDSLVWSSENAASWENATATRNRGFYARPVQSPRHDLAFYLPNFSQASNTVHKNDVPNGNLSESGTGVSNLSKEGLTKLVDNGLTISPFSNSQAPSNCRTWPSYPWFISMTPTFGFCESSETYSAAAAAATATLKMYENAGRYSGPGKKKNAAPIPPVTVMTSHAGDIRVWLAYSVKDSSYVFTENRATQMICIWQGSKSNLSSLIQLRVILCNLHTWAMTTLRHQLSQYLDQWIDHTSKKHPNLSVGNNSGTKGPRSDPQSSTQSVESRPQLTSSSLDSSQSSIAEAVPILEEHIQKLLSENNEMLIDAVRKELPKSTAPFPSLFSQRPSEANITGSLFGKEDSNVDRTHGQSFFERWGNTFGNQNPSAAWPSGPSLFEQTKPTGSLFEKPNPFKAPGSASHKSIGTTNGSAVGGFGSRANPNASAMENRLNSANAAASCSALPRTSIDTHHGVPSPSGTPKDDISQMATTSTSTVPLPSQPISSSTSTAAIAPNSTRQSSSAIGPYTRPQNRERTPSHSPQPLSSSPEDRTENTPTPRPSVRFVPPKPEHLKSDNGKGKGKAKEDLSLGEIADNMYRAAMGMQTESGKSKNGDTVLKTLGQDVAQSGNAGGGGLEQGERSSGNISNFQQASVEDAQSETDYGSDGWTSQVEDGVGED